LLVVALRIQIVGLAALEGINAEDGGTAAACLIPASK